MINDNWLIRIFVIFTVSIVISSAVHARKYQPVDCDSGDEIQRALEQRNYNEKLSIQISGTCDEDVVIKNDDVILEALDPTAMPSIKSITVEGARRVMLMNLEVSNNSGTGVIAKKGASLDVQGGSIKDNSVDGLAVETGATATLDGVEVSGNAENGISADKNASVKVMLGDLVSDFDSDPAPDVGPLAAEAKNNSLLEFSGTNIEGDITAFNNSTIEGAEASAGSIFADLGSTVIGSSADEIIANLGSTVIGSSANEISASRRSVVVNVPTEVKVVLKSQSVADVADADSLDECDYSSSVFEGENIDTTVGCVRQDLNHFYDKIAALPIELFEDLSEVVQTLFDDMLVHLNDWIDGFNFLT